MKLEQVKALMKDMAKLADAHRGYAVRRAVLDTTMGSVEVEAKANRIGFVYWHYDGKVVPRKRLESLLERPEITEVL